MVVCYHFVVVWFCSIEFYYIIENLSLLFLKMVHFEWFLYNNLFNNIVIFYS